MRHCGYDRVQPLVRQQTHAKLSPAFVYRAREPQHHYSAICAYSPVVLISSLTTLVAKLPAGSQKRISTVTSSHQFQLNCCGYSSIALRAASTFSRTSKVCNSVS